MGQRRKRKRPTEEFKEEGGHVGYNPVTMLHAPLPLLPITPPQDVLSAEVAPASDFKYLTRNVKAVLDRCAKRSASIRSPVRNVNGLVTSTLAGGQDHPTLVSDIPASTFTSDLEQTQDLNFPGFSGSNALPSDTFRNHDISVPTESGVQSIYSDHDSLDIKKLTDELLGQNHGPGVVCPAVPSNSEIVVDNYQPVREANAPSYNIGNTKNENTSKRNQSGAHLSRSLSLNLTQMISLMGDDSLDTDEVGSRYTEALVTVNGYQVKEELVPIIRDIFTRYGDIAKDSSFCSVKSRSCLLEIVCGIYQNLEASNFIQITLKELNSLLDEVKDLETAKVEVGWLHHRLDEIFEGKQLLKSLKEEKTRNIQTTKSRRKILDDYKRELEAVMARIHHEEEALNVAEAEAEKINEKFCSVKSKVKAFYQKSLVCGLL